MNEINRYRRKIDCFGSGVLKVSPPIPSIDGWSLKGLFASISGDSLLVLKFPVEPFELLISYQHLKEAGLTDRVIRRIRQSLARDRFEDIKETLLVKEYQDLSVESSPFLQEIHPWKPIADELMRKIRRLTVYEPAIKESQDFFNRIVQLRKSFVFTMIKVSDFSEFIIGRMRLLGDVFVVSKKLGTKSLFNENGTSIRKATVEEISESASRDIVLKEISETSEDQALIEKKGHKSVQDLSPYIIEYLGDLIDSEQASWKPIGLVLPAFSGDAFIYLEKLLLSQKKVISFKKRHDIFIDVFKKVASAVETMHQNNLVHSDIKAENIFLSWNESDLSITDVVLADFTKTDPQERDFRVSYKFTFLEEYQEAENALRFEKEKAFEVKKRIDVRQLGFFFYGVFATIKKKGGVCEEAPYPLKKALKRSWPDPSQSYKELPDGVSLELRTLIKKMLSPHVSEVPSIEEVCKTLNRL